MACFKAFIHYVECIMSVSVIFHLDHPVFFVTFAGDAGGSYGPVGVLH